VEQQQLVETSDGRVLETRVFGAPSGPTVFFHHGTPGSYLTGELFDDAATRAGLSVVTMSRAGYGLSTRHAGRSVSSVVSDVGAVLDALGRDSYVAAGWSGGGPHSLACGALDAPRCRAAWSLAGVAPIDADFDWTAGMGPENLEEFALAREGGPHYEQHMASLAAEFGAATADNIVQLFGGLLSDPDKAVLADEPARAAMAKDECHAFAGGWRGFYDDDQAFMSSWGFDVATITVPVHVWFADQDLMAPPSHGEWLGATIPHARVRREAGEGHLSLVHQHLDELCAAWRDAAQG
jgi:pimeloyl-ACP methyl ester carboxylesterase